MRKRKVSFGVVLLVAALLVFFGIQFYSSLFFQAPDRIQMVVHGPQTRFYSLSTREGVDYYIPYDSNLKIQVPGGYGPYRIGALSKLSSDEKKPELFDRSFSVATSSLVTYHFYPRDTEIYYDSSENPRYSAPSIGELFFFKSNARFFDRLYLGLQFVKKPAHLFEGLKLDLLTKQVQNTIYLTSDAFAEEYRGYLYQKTYRNEQVNVQIKYTKNYNTAAAVAQILEGSGIRVVDIAKADGDSKKCLIISDTKTGSNTVKDLKTFFGCEVEEGKTEVSDAVFVLGDIEDVWEL